MKKILMLLLGTMLVLSMTGVVSAGENPITFNETDFTDSNHKSAQVDVTLTLQQFYEVTIPANVVLTEHTINGVPTYSGYNWLNASVHLMAPGKGLVVNITGSYAAGTNADMLWNLSSTDDDDVAQYIIGYTKTPSDHIAIGSNTQISNGSQVIGIKTPGTKSELCIHYKLVTPVSQLNTKTYKDTLTFNVHVVDDDDVDPMDPEYYSAI